MYPQGELKLLELQKARLQRAAAHHRAECARAAAELARPVEWLDEARARWRRVSPLVKIGGVAVGLLARRSLIPRRMGLAKWIRWGTAAIGLVRGLRAMRQ